MFVVGASFFAVGAYRWRNPDGHPTGYIAWAEQRFTVGAFRRRPMAPWWAAVPLGAILTVAGLAGVILSLR